MSGPGGFLIYLETMKRLRLDGYVYPAIQMPPVDETMPQDGRLSEGPPVTDQLGEYIGRASHFRNRRLL